LPKNIGKSGAILEGLKFVTSDTTILLDGDLINLTSNDLSKLIQPLRSTRNLAAIVTLGNAPLIAHILKINPVSGQRAIPTKLLKNIKPVQGYEFEIALNQILLDNKIKIKVVGWPTVTHLTKTKKHNFWKGLSLDLKMNFQILKTFGIVYLINQYWKLSKAI
jgi:hypothetical protein